MDEVRSICRTARGRKRGAFSLIELIAVVAIIAVMVGISMPFLANTLRGSSLTRGGQLITDQFALARQEAVTQNCDVEVRFFRLATGGNSGWRAVQLWRVEQTATGPSPKAFSRISTLPEGVEMADRNGLSPLITSAPLNGSADLGAGYGLLEYRGFRFRPNGSVETAVGEGNYVTLTQSGDTKNPPANYCTVQLNVLTGKSSVYRP